MNWILRVAAIWATLMVVAGLELFEGFRIEGGMLTALLAAIILSIMNAIVKPILVFLTLPITFITFGLFLLVINAITLLLTSAIIDGFIIEGFWVAFWAGIIISILNYLIQKLILDRLK
jgi:putative membrane protein